MGTVPRSSYDAPRCKNMHYAHTGERTGPRIPRTPRRPGRARAGPLIPCLLATDQWRGAHAALPPAVPVCAGRVRGACAHAMAKPWHVISGYSRIPSTARWMRSISSAVTGVAPSAVARPMAASASATSFHVSPAWPFTFLSTMRPCSFFRARAKAPRALVWRGRRSHRSSPRSGGLSAASSSSWSCVEFPEQP